MLPPRGENNKAATASLEPPLPPGTEVTVTVAEDGTVSVNGRPVRLSGLSLVPKAQLCQTAAGERWTCGLRAFVAIRNFVHGKNLRCDGDFESTSSADAVCYLDRTNVSDWIVSEGWAIYDNRTNSETLAKLSSEAKAEKRGIWTNDSQMLTGK